MTMYWVYELPNWLFGVLSISAFVAFGLIGLFPTRRWVRRQHQVDHSHNDIVGFYLAAITVFYGITLGLVAVGTWTTYSDVEAKVDREAEIISSLARDVNGYPQPYRAQMQDDLRAYLKEVIDHSWPQQRQGIVPVGTSVYVDSLQQHILAFQPASPAEQILDTEAYKQFNELVECRRARLNAVTTGMPGSLWCLVIIGAMISIVTTLFFDTPSLKMHIWMTVLLSGLLGLMIFLVGTLDNPFRGKVSVGPQAFERVYRQITARQDKPPAAP